MKTQELYFKAERNGAYFECDCTGISSRKWDSLMKGHTRANKKLVTKIAAMANVISEDQAAQEIKRPYYNPYNHYKTKTHVIYVHSSIEHFIRIN